MLVLPRMMASVARRRRTTTASQGGNGAKESKGAGGGVKAVARGDAILEKDGNIMHEARSRTAVAVGVGEGIGVKFDDGVEGWVKGVDSI